MFPKRRKIMIFSWLRNLLLSVEIPSSCNNHRRNLLHDGKSHYIPDSKTIEKLIMKLLSSQRKKLLIESASKVSFVDAVDKFKDKINRN